MRWWEWLGSSAQVGNTVQHSWPLPAWVTVLAVMVCLAWVWRSYRPSRQDPSGERRWWGGMLLRIGALLLLFWMMIGATWHRYETELPELLVVLDNSGSMSHEDLTDAEGGDLSRFSAVKQALLQKESQRLQQLKQRYRLRIFTLSDVLRELPNDEIPAMLEEAALAPSDHASRLGDGIAELLLHQGARSTAAILLISDGVTTMGRSLEGAAKEARQRGIPLWLATTGDARAKLDLRLSDLVHQDVAFPDDQITFEAKLSCEGKLPQARTVAVQLLRGTQVVAETEAEFNAQDSAGGEERQTTTVRMTYRPSEPGRQQLVVRAAPLEDEENLENNQLDAAIEVRDETIRVFMVSAHPTFDYQFLRNLLAEGLRRDSQASAFALTTVLQDGDPEHHLQDSFAAPAFPATRDELFAYDVVVMGDVDAKAFSTAQVESLHAFVAERGGAMVVLSGPEHTPVVWAGSALEELLPIQLSSIKAPEPGTWDQPLALRLTPLGSDSPQLQLTDRIDKSAEDWRKLPPLYWCLQSRAKPGVRVLATLTGAGPGDNATPVICSRFFGAGTVLFHATDESYRWSTGEMGQQPYARYWLQTLRYLSRTKLGDDGGVELTADADRYPQGATPEFRVRFLNPREAPPDNQGVSLVLESEGRRRQVRLRRWKDRKAFFSGRAEGLPEGSYRAWLAEPNVQGELPTCAFVISPPQTEMSRLVVDLEGLEQVAKTAGGESRPLKELDALLRSLPAGRRLRVSPLPPQPLWNSNFIAALFVTLLTLEWMLRRRAGVA